MMDLMKENYSENTDFELTNAYFNNLIHNASDEEMEYFMEEVDRRRGMMLRSEWLDYNY